MAKGASASIDNYATFVGVHEQFLVSVGCYVIFIYHSS